MEQPRLAKPISASRCTISGLMGPQEANQHGVVHGGVIMKMVDEAGALAAMRHANSPVVTVVIDSMTFMESIQLGNFVQCNAELTYAGRTSMEARVEVITENPLTGAAQLTNTAYLVYVAIDSQRKPIPVPTLDLLTDNERERAEQARQRQEYRKQQRALERR